MGWATGHIERLKAGETVSFRPHGNSMTPRVKSGELCTVAPVEDPNTLPVDSIVLCKVKGNQYLHILSAKRGEQFQISNNHGFVNGWISANAIYGVLTNVSK